MNALDSIDPGWAWAEFQPTPDRPWNHELAAHLYRRAGFGADWSQLQSAVRRSPGELVETLVTQNLEESDFRATADSLANTVLAGGDPKQLAAAWVYRLLFTPTQLLEKATLFWHGHFATSADKVTDARMMWNQNQLLRQHALGDFASLVQSISQDPAMLVYLDSAINRKAHPNENFARELMELFCLGEGNYTERDVQELARCFTGWEIKNKRFRKNRYQQDTGEKTVLGSTGTFDGEDAVRVVLQQPRLELFLARKWFRYFVGDEPNPSDELLAPLAARFRDHDLQVAPALRMILSSNIFFSEHAIGRKVKSPVEHVIGLLRCVRGTTNTETVAQGLHGIGQGLFFPPNVKGWDGGRAWIDSSTLLGRSNLIGRVLSDTATRFDSGSLSEYLKSVNVNTTDDAITHFERCLLAFPLNQSTRQQLQSKYMVDNDDAPAQREQNFRSLLHGIASLPVCQLA